jgi:two-component system, LuxR family, sensor kinase FixL
LANLLLNTGVNYLPRPSAGLHEDFGGPMIEFMTEYAAWSRDDLIKRVRELEEKLDLATTGQSAALKDSEARIRAILETAVEGIITIDERGLIESLNSAAERLFGYTRAELIGRNVSVLMPSPYKEEHDSYMSNYVTTGHRKIIGIGREVVGQRKDGSVFPMDLSVGELNVGGKRLFTGIVRDITVRKRAEEQLEHMARTLTEKNKELETIVYVASHDLRSPLVNIQGFSKELAHSCKQVRDGLTQAATMIPSDVEQIISHEIPESISYILAGVNKIETLLSGFLRFSRLGRAALKIERVNMQSLLGNVLKTMEFQLKISTQGS